MLVAIKLGSSPIFYSHIKGRKTELNLDCTFHQNDTINCTIIKGDNLVAKSGNKIYTDSIKEYFHIPIDSQKKTEKSAVKEYQDTINQTTTDIEKESCTKSNSETESDSSNFQEPTTVTQKKTENSAPDHIDKDFLSRLTSQNTENFYPSIKEKLDELFVIHPADENLNRAITDSKWIKIFYDNEDYYVVGKLFDNDKIAYLSYGVPGIASIAPPKLAEDICQWFPVSNMSGSYEGYYLIFQNAYNGNVEKT